MNDPAGMFQIFSLVLIFVVIYFLMIRPQSKRQKEREGMLKRVKKGDRIVTTSGFYGTVVSLKGDDVLIVKLAENVRVDMSRAAVASILESTEVVTE